MAELGLYEISITGIWEAILSWTYKEKKADLTEFKPWFDKWYDTIGVRALDIDSARLLALPCQLFDHAEGYARVTKFLAYNSMGHVKERQQKDFKAKSLHIAPAEFVGKSSQYGRVPFLSTRCFCYSRCRVWNTWVAPTDGLDGVATTDSQPAH
jgi:hypothetical protein